MNPLIQLKKTAPVFFVALVCFALSSTVKAVLPAPDGGYPGANTAEGQNALLSLTTGHHNTAVGYFSLKSDVTGSYNTAIGAGALLANTVDQNTAIGFGALLSNTDGYYNTATGALALFHNATGANNNTATGQGALFNNTTGLNNTATGASALETNTTGGANTAVGYAALIDNSGSFNTALGQGAGGAATTGDHNVYIGAAMAGVAGESNACYIASISGQASANGIPVLINSNNKLGTTTSSKRFKEQIAPMDKASEALFALKPVCFRYKKDIDPAGTPQLGLVAEDVEKVNRDLVVRDKEGKPYSVRYDQVNAMLLNEFLKEHRKVEKLEVALEAVTARLEQQATQIQKVSAQLEASKPAPQVVNNP
jgi:hypothetical protein